jgi:hypothetical protein
VIQSIIDGICRKLKSEFGDGFRIYTESIKQGLSEPCFYIQALEPASTQFFGKRYFRRHPFIIQYFPESGRPKEECNKVQEKLYLALEHIAVNGDLTRGEKMHGEYSDGVLNFFVNYDMFVYVKGGEPDKMGAISKIITTKGNKP